MQLRLTWNKTAKISRLLIAVLKNLITWQECSERVKLELLIWQTI